MSARKRVRSVNLSQRKRSKTAKPLFGPVRYRVRPKASATSAVCRVFVDGACSGNNHRRAAERLGGYGAYFETNGAELGGSLSDSAETGEQDDLMTNNRMELLAVIVLLERVVEYRSAHTQSSAGTRFAALPAELALPSAELRVVGDNQYVLNAIIDWLPGWRKSNFRKAKGGAVKNVDLIRRLDDLLLGFESKQWPLSFQWVRAHQAKPLASDSEYFDLWRGNQRADSVATRAAAGSKL